MQPSRRLCSIAAPLQIALPGTHRKNPATLRQRIMRSSQTVRGVRGQSVGWLTATSSTSASVSCFRAARMRRLTRETTSSARQSMSAVTGCQVSAVSPAVPALLQTVLPNTSLNRTRYGRRRKPGVRRLRHLRTSSLRRLPHRAV